MFRKDVSVVMVGLVSAIITHPLAAQDANLAWLVAEMQEMREEIRLLRGEIEDQQREIRRLSERQRDQYMDLDRRISAADAVQDETGGYSSAPPVDTGNEPPMVAHAPVTVQDPPVSRDEGPEVRDPVNAQSEITPLAPPVAAGPRDLGTPGAEEQAAYDAAFRALRELRYADAAEGFDDFLRRYPDSGYSPNAQYWLGEAYYVNRDFATALSTFQTLLSRYPGSNKQGDALLKIGFSHYELRQWPEARAALEQVRTDYGGTTLARLAENRLRNMRLEGHY